MFQRFRKKIRTVLLILFFLSFFFFLFLKKNTVSYVPGVIVLFVYRTFNNVIDLHVAINFFSDIERRGI